MIQRTSERGAIFLIALALSGCGSGLDLEPVTGKVTVNGKPVTQGEVTFLPENGPPAIGSISADGTYQLTTVEPGDGAVRGHHKVTIMATKVSGGSVAPATFEQELEWAKKGVNSSGKVLIPGDVTWVVPEKYSRSQTSDLTASVIEGENTINFDLSDSK